MTSKTLKIAIDGPCGVGKSTTAIELAKKLGFTRVDSGMLYRAVTFAVLRKKQGWHENDNFTKCVLKDKEIQKYENYINNLLIKEDQDSTSGFRVFVHDEDENFNVTFEIKSEDLRTRFVEKNVSILAKLPFVRKKVGEIQHEIINTSFPGVIVDGRDIGTVVMPDAQFKFYLTASEDVRARRRYHENLEKSKTIPNLPVDFDQILKDIKERDFNDINRTYGPLKQADDAIVIDNSNITLIEQVNLLYDYIHPVLNKQ